jgi:uracil-DNA glycosylase
MEQLLEEIRSCSVCLNYLPYSPKPIIQASKNARIVIIGQAPGQKVQNSGVPWDDRSGDELRRWLGVTREQFYDETLFALVPMGFCYPGKGVSGDLPPRPECAPLWHESLLNYMSEIKLIILVGKYAQNYYLKHSAKPSLTETVRSYLSYLPTYLPLVHPSPRNGIWQRKNPWFEIEVLPFLQQLVKKAFQDKLA